MVFGLISELSLRAFETVEIETLNSFANSFKVIFDLITLRINISFGSKKGETENYLFYKIERIFNMTCYQNKKSRFL
jgi:hypothetical protein